MFEYYKSKIKKIAQANDNDNNTKREYKGWRRQHILMSGSELYHKFLFFIFSLCCGVSWCVKIVWYPYTSWLDRTLNFIALNGTQLIFRPFFDLNFTSHVSFHVQGQMIRTWEAAITIAALERFCSCVFAIMTCKLIAPCKSPFAALPRALVGLLTCNERNS